MIGDAPPTSFDLKFRLFRIPVRVHPLFWLIMALLGNWSLEKGVEYLLIWVACGFVSILLHEMGHAVAARVYGAYSTITLVAFGGFAAYSPVPRKAWKRLLITAAGPAVNFALVGLILGIEVTLRAANVAPSPHLAMALFYLFVQNLVWGIFNLFPIWPLDGGRMLRELCALGGSRKPDIITHTVSICVAGFLALWGILTLTGQRFPAIEALFYGFRPSIMMTMFFALFAFENYQMLDYHKRQRRAYYNEDDDTPPWRR